MEEPEPHSLCTNCRIIETTEHLHSFYSPPSSDDKTQGPNNHSGFPNSDKVSVSLVIRALNII